MLSGGRVFLLALYEAGQASLPWVLYEASRPTSVAARGALNVAKLALLGKGVRSASLRRAGHLEHPKLCFKFDILIITVSENVFVPE